MISIPTDSYACFHITCFLSIELCQNDNLDCLPKLFTCKSELQKVNIIPNCHITNYADHSLIVKWASIFNIEMTHTENIWPCKIFSFKKEKPVINFQLLSTNRILSAYIATNITLSFSFNCRKFTMVDIQSIFNFW